MKFTDIFKSIFKSDSLKTVTEAIGDEDRGFRRISEDAGLRGLSPTARNDQNLLGFALWTKNGFAKRILEIPIDFIFGQSLYEPTIASANDLISEETATELQKLLTNFIKDNKLSSKLEKFYLDLTLNGSLLNPVAVNKFNGAVTIGFIDPSKIDNVSVNPYDVTDVTKVKLKRNTSGEEKVFEIIRKKSAFEDFGSTEYNLLTGDAFFVSINNVSNQPEGVSDLLANIDFIEYLTSLLASIVEGIRLQNLFVWDVTIQGADEIQIREWIKANPIPTRASRSVHNEKVIMGSMTAGISAVDSAQTVKMIKNFVLGNYSYPAMWFADGTDANRAIAVEQGTPIYKKLEKRQETLIDFLKNMYTFVIHQAQIYKQGIDLTKEQLESLSISIVAPPIAVKDTVMLTNTLNTLVTSLATAEDRGWATTDTIRDVYLNGLNGIGMNIDIESEKKTLEEQAEEKARVKAEEAQALKDQQQEQFQQTHNSNLELLKTKIGQQPVKNGL